MRIAGPRTVHVEHCMGTVFSIDIRDDGDWRAPIAEVVTWLHHVDEVFSTYRPDSVVSKLDRGEIELADCSAEVRDAFATCADLARATGGYFSIRPAGRLDPSGFVKGWAIERASELLRSRGSRNHAVNGGGDVQLAGSRSPGSSWRVGINDPAKHGQLAAVVSAADAAVATSGTAERGAHVTDPLTGQEATELASVTVVGRHLARADAYATAALAMGPACLPWLEELSGYDALVIGADGQRWQTTGFPAWTAKG